MKRTYLIILFSINLNCLSQVDNCNVKCEFKNNNLEIFSQNIKDTIYVKIALRNKISENFVQSDLIRISYKYDKNNSYFEPYEINTNKLNEITNRNIYDLYKIFRPCLLKYENTFFEDNRDGIIKLESNDISYYYYRVNLIIYPEID